MKNIFDNDKEISDEEIQDVIRKLFDMAKENNFYFSSLEYCSSNLYKTIFKMFCLETQQMKAMEYILNYINCKPEFLEPYNDIKLDVELIYGSNYDFLKTSIGTYLVDKNTVDISDRQINLLDLYKILVLNNNQLKRRKDINTFLNYRNVEVDYYDIKASFLVDLIKMYTYYVNVVNNNMKEVPFCQAYEYFHLPIEFFNNPQFEVDLDLWKISYPDLFEKFKACYENGYTFDDNKKLMFFMIKNTDFDNKYIKDNIEYFKSIIMKKGNIDYSIAVYNYLKGKMPEELDDQFLLSMYKKDVTWISKDYTTFYRIAKNIPNNSPMVRLTKDSEPVHLRCRKYELFKDKPARYHGGLEDFEEEFIGKNATVVKLYQRYYKMYLKNIDDEKLDNISDFIRKILLTPRFFKLVVDDTEITISEVRELMVFIKCYSKDEQEKFKQFYNQFKKDETARWFSIYNLIVRYKDDPKKLEEILSQCNINQNNAYQKVISNKFWDSTMKSTMFGIIRVHYGDFIKVIDIINILDEMIEREITINEILNEKNISKKFFDSIYESALKNNPILYEYISESLAENKRRGYKKLIRLGYSILNSNLQSYSEYKEKFPEYDFDSLLLSLKGTELVEKLTSLAQLWEDYEIIDKKIK